MFLRVREWSNLYEQILTLPDPQEVILVAGCSLACPDERPILVGRTLEHPVCWGFLAFGGYIVMSLFTVPVTASTKITPLPSNTPFLTS